MVADRGSHPAAPGPACGVTLVLPPAAIFLAWYEYARCPGCRGWSERSYTEGSVIMAELAGIMVGNYFLLECLSSEGMAETYRARPTTHGGYDVYLRLFRPRFPDPLAFQDHFPSEVRKVWRCQHPHIQSLTEFGAGDDLLYTATRADDALTLEQILEKQGGKRLPVELVAQWMTQLCEALQYAHEHEIVHGNLQPSS